MKWWFQKIKPKIDIIESKLAENKYPDQLLLTIDLKDQDSFTLGANGIKNIRLGQWNAYKEFKKWFHSRPQSSMFIFTWKDTEKAVLREHILSYKFAIKRDKDE